MESATPIAQMQSDLHSQREAIGSAVQGAPSSMAGGNDRGRPKWKKERKVECMRCRAVAFLFGPEILLLATEILTRWYIRLDNMVSATQMIV
jgi:hypothetical protein